MRISSPDHPPPRTAVAQPGTRAAAARVDPHLWRTEANPQKLALLDRWAAGTTATDVGCGAGTYARRLAERGFDVVAVDQEIPPLDAGAKVRFVRAAVPPIPGPDASSDTVLLFDVLEHVADEDALLREARRVCRARLLLSVPSDDDGELPRYGVCLVHHVDRSHVRAYGEGAIRAALERCGFRVVHVEPSFPSALPEVACAFFASTAAGRVARLATAAWLRAMRALGLLRVTLPGDWFVVAEPVDEKTGATPT